MVNEDKSQQNVAICYYSKFEYGREEYINTDITSILK